MANKKSEGTKKSTTKKKTTAKNASTKKTTTKKATSKKTDAAKKTVKKVTPKKTNTEKLKVVKEEVVNLDLLEERIDKEIENNSVTLEDTFLGKKGNKKLLLSIGVFISILGLIALIISLIANRVIDREYIGDTGIIVMITVSIIIEIFGAIIIINES